MYCHDERVGSRLEKPRPHTLKGTPIVIYQTGQARAGGLFKKNTFDTG